MHSFGWHLQLRDQLLLRKLTSGNNGITPLRHGSLEPIGPSVPVQVVMVGNHSDWQVQQAAGRQCRWAREAQRMDPQEIKRSLPVGPNDIPRKNRIGDEPAIPSTQWHAREAQVGHFGRPEACRQDYLNLRAKLSQPSQYFSIVDLTTKGGLW
jgi:hypothetical protein